MTRTKKGQDIKSITFSGVKYYLPLHGRFRLHNETELDDMRESIRSRGVLRSIRVYRDTDLNLANCVLDGAGRLSLAAELKLPRKLVKFQKAKAGKMTTEEAYNESLAHNDARRQDSPEAIQKRRQERVVKVAEMRSEEGKSLRVIADELEISETQVRRDLASAAAAGAPGGAPETVVGRNGTRQKATKAPKGIEERVDSILNALLTVSRLINTAIKEEDGEKLLKYLTFLKLIVYPQDVIKDGEKKEQNPKFKGFPGFRRVLKLAALTGRARSEAEVRREMKKPDEEE